jgi:aerobic-type carbon monoxide dehydrogenase small subunit (CoxS/CutS family)
MTGIERERSITLAVNGVEHTVQAETRTLLVDLLRHQLGLTGTHVGCEQGSCGACTIICDGQAVRSCLMLAPQADGAVIETIEAVTTAHPVVSAMHEQHGLQCGFCTAGIVMSLVAAQRDGWTVEAAIEDALGGHLCRCTGYVNIRAAIREPSSSMRIRSTSSRPAATSASGRSDNRPAIGSGTSARTSVPTTTQ